MTNNKTKTKVKRPLTRFIDLFSVIESSIGYWWAGALILFVMIFISSEIAGRFLFNHSFDALIDVVSLCVMVITFSALSIVQRQNSHISMDILTDKLKGTRTGAIIDLIVLLIVLVISSIIFYSVAIQALKTIQGGYVTPSIYMLIWPAAIFMPIGLILLCFRLLIQIYQRFRSIISWKQH